MKMFGMLSWRTEPVRNYDRRLLLSEVQYYHSFRDGWCNMFVTR
jgi:hypothetical protein